MAGENVRRIGRLFQLCLVTILPSEEILCLHRTGENATPRSQAAAAVHWITAAPSSLNIALPNCCKQPPATSKSMLRYFTAHTIIKVGENSHNKQDNVNIRELFTAEYKTKTA